MPPCTHLDISPADTLLPLCGPGIKFTPTNLFTVGCSPCRRKKGSWWLRRDVLLQHTTLASISPRREAGMTPAPIPVNRLVTTALESVDDDVQ